MTDAAAPNHDLPTRPVGRVLRAAEATAWQEGFAFREAAKRESAELRDAARKAYASEYAQGYDDGLIAGSAEAVQLLTATTVSVDRYLEKLEGEVIDLALDVVRKMLGGFDAGTLVAKAARQAIADVRRAKYLRISVHPDMLDTVRTELNDMLAAGEIGFSVEIEADGQLAHHACVVKTDAAVVDASIEGQLAALRSALQAKAGGAA